MKKKIKEINDYARRIISLKLELIKYEGDTLTIHGSDDFSYYHKLELTFSDIIHFRVEKTWDAEDNNDLLRIGKRIEKGNVFYYLQFSGMDNLYITCGKLDYSFETVLYFYKEHLGPNERLADWVKKA